MLTTMDVIVNVMKSLLFLWASERTCSSSLSMEEYLECIKVPREIAFFVWAMALGKILVEDL